MSHTVIESSKWNAKNRANLYSSNSKRFSNLKSEKLKRQKSKTKRLRSFSQTKTVSNKNNESLSSERDFTWVYDQYELENEMMKIQLKRSSKPLNIWLDTKAFKHE